MLERLRSVLGERAAPLDVFFRDDDADRDIPELRRLDAMFARHEAPVALAVIPGTLTPECAALLRSRPHIEPHQHGWIHANHEPAGRKCEFGPSRTFEQQLIDIARGSQRMSELLGATWTRAFTPPWNRCTAETFRALDELGFLILSKDATSPRVAAHRFREVSIGIDIFRWQGGAKLKSEEELMAEFEKRAALPGPIGILLHHKVMDDAAFQLVDGLLERLRASRTVSIHTLAALANKEQS